MPCAGAERMSGVLVSLPAHKCPPAAASSAERDLSARAAAAASAAPVANRGNRHLQRDDQGVGPEDGLADGGIGGAGLRVAPQRGLEAGGRAVGGSGRSQGRWLPLPADARACRQRGCGLQTHGQLGNYVVGECKHWVEERGQVGGRWVRRGAVCSPARCCGPGLPRTPA